MLQLLRMHQHAALFQQFNDERVCFEHLLAVVFRQAVVNDSGGIHIRVTIEFVFHAGGKIFRAMRRRGVHYARARVHGDVVSQDAKNRAIQKRMAKISVLQLFAGEVCQLAGRGQPDLFGKSIGQLCRNNVNLIARFQSHILFFRMKRDRLRCRQRPRRGGPDYGEHFFAGERRVQLRRIVL